MEPEISGFVSTISIVRLYSVIIGKNTCGGADARYSLALASCSPFR
jgi:hypothetical protein